MMNFNRLVSRPNPAWDLTRVAHLVYSEAVNGAYDIPRWPGHIDELYELAALPQLGNHTSNPISQHDFRVNESCSWLDSAH